MTSKRLSSASPPDVPGPRGRETPEPASNHHDKVSGRMAGIIGASSVIAVIAGILTYFATGKTGGSTDWGIIAGGGAFVSAFGFLNSIIA